MRVEFVTRENGPERLLAEAEVIFDNDGPFAGMKLCGFSVWGSPDGEIYVTFPARAFGQGTDRRFFDYLRPAASLGTSQGSMAPKTVKAWIKGEYLVWNDLHVVTADGGRERVNS